MKAALIIATATAAGNTIGQLSAATSLSLGEVATVFVFCTGLVVWLTRKLQKIEDDLANLTREFSGMSQRCRDYCASQAPAPPCA